MSNPDDSVARTILVAVVLCLVCSILVSGAAVMLRPVQQANKTLDRQRNILEIAGIPADEGRIAKAFGSIEARVVDLANGSYVGDLDPLTYDARKAARDPARSTELQGGSDIARIGRLAQHATVYLMREGDRITRVILPVHGYGLWSTLYGFLALEGDGRTISGLKFYEHAETPGLGGEVDNPDWRAQWAGKVAYDEAGYPAIEVVRGKADPASDAYQHQVDGLSGATLTSKGVENLVRFWLGPLAFGPYIERLRAGEA
ncbi:MAG: Na(+)-translocating NADH-quinone reductase subunit C [Gammaproteobacteria bacterium]|nr:Na(+)-translocating NADH-quinone reductase subunit C [Gammaproteobacteria bacterium]